MDRQYLLYLCGCTYRISSCIQEIDSDLTRWTGYYTDLFSMVTPRVQVRASRVLSTVFISSCSPTHYNLQASDQLGQLAADLEEAKPNPEYWVCSSN